MIFILFSVNGFIVIAFFYISSNIFQIKSYIFPGVKIASDLKKKCPICPALVIKLPRHMRSVHKMLPEEQSIWTSLRSSRLISVRPLTGLIMGALYLNCGKLELVA